VSARAEAVRAAALAFVTALAIVLLAPPGGDTAAHLYRTLLVREGVAVWDNLWFAGHYALASYSLLYYLPAALVGNVAVVVAAVVASAALFAAIVVDEWGPDVRWAARAFAILAAGPLFTGTYSYAAGIAAALATLRLLQLGRPVLGVVAAAVTVALSPLAFAFLVLTLAAVAVARPTLDRRTALVGAGLGAIAVAELALLALFPSEGEYLFSPLSLGAALTVSALGALLAWRADRGTVLVAFFGLWAAVCLVGFTIPSPFGDTLTRLRSVVFALVLLAALLARFRPRLLAATALAVALGYNLAPDISALPKRAGDVRTSQESFWRPALDFLHEHADDEHRVEVVPTFGHWEAWWVPRERFALARGWYRQLDIAENPELYRQLTPVSYRRWLDRMAVRWILVPNARLGPLGASDEAELLRSGLLGFPVRLETRDWTIYEVPRARRILGGGTVDAFDHDRIAGRVPAAGSYRLAVRYTPRWAVSSGAVCVEEAPDGTTTLRARRGGGFELEVRLVGANAECG